MARISQNTIELIRNTADIVDVVSEYVTLQPSGKNFKGLCPFHSEKTPSFFVDKERGFFHCFGCGEKGNVISFVQKYKNTTFVEALQELAEKFHIPIETEGDEVFVDHNKRPYEINETANSFFQVSLTNLEKGKQALEYIQGRGLDIHTIQYFELGFAPNEQKALFNQLKENYEPVEMMELGLAKKGETDYYDLFRNRLMFPIRNEYGKTVGFSGRILENNPNEPKYVNSPQTKIFTKGQVLYNLDKAIPFINREKRVVLFEGFLDVIAAFSAGIKEGICSMGTALTPEQASLIKKHTDHAILCYDGDSAGFEATSKAIPILEGSGLHVSVVLLPEKLDPDDFVKKHSKAAFVKQINERAIDPFEFEYTYMKSGVDLKKPSQVEELKLRVFNYLFKSDSQMLLEIYSKRLAEDLKVSFETIQSDLHHFQLTKAITNSLNKRKEKIVNIVIQDKAQKAEKRLLCYFIKAKEYRDIIINDIGNMFTKDKLSLEIMINAEDFIQNGFTENLKEKIIATFSEKKRPLVEKKLSDYDEPYSSEDLTQLLMSFKISLLEDEVRAIDEEMKETIDVDKEKYNYLRQKKLDILIKIRELRKDTSWKKTKS